MSGRLFEFLRACGRGRACTLVLVGSWLLASSALANGRMPGANDLVFSAGDPARMVARATFGIVQSVDRGATWSWVCEQAIDVSGVVADPPITMTADGTLVLLPPTGSALVSSDRGCNWVRVAAPLVATRGADLTVDPSDEKRVLVVTSTLRKVDDAGFGVYENLVVETRDDARSFVLLATLPGDFEAETIEVARSDARRIYVSGSDAHDPRLGVILRSDDAGATWSRSILSLPAGTGSLWISGIHPRDPDRLWVRVAARGDTIGLLPARLYLSTDKGATFTMLAATTKGMFGFALSPDGSSVAYGGPTDGLFVGPSDGSGFVKRSALGVRCLRWPLRDALYVCASEPADPFSLGVSSDDGLSFRALYKLTDTCPATCATGTSFADSCEVAWSQTRPFIQASGAMCSVPWSAPMSSDAGLLDASVVPSSPTSSGDSGPTPTLDASPAPTDAAASATEQTEASGCDCQLAPSLRSRAGGRAAAHGSSWYGGALGSLAALLALGGRQRRRQRLASGRAV